MANEYDLNVIIAGSITMSAGADGKETTVGVALTDLVYVGAGFGIVTIQAPPTNEGDYVKVINKGTGFTWYLAPKESMTISVDTSNPPLFEAIGLHASDKLQVNEVK